MQRWLSRGVAGALLLCLLAFLIAYSRLDEPAISREVMAQLEQASGMNVHAQHTNLSLQHGLSLKVSQLSVDGKGGWSLTADIARFDIPVTALLFGDLHFASIDLVHPVLHLQHSVPPGRLFGPVLVARVMRDAGGLSLRQGSIMLHDMVLADQVEGSLRRVVNGGQTNWEVQCRYAGGDVNSQGYFRTNREGREKVFGRISATQLHLSQMPDMPLPPLHYDLLDASLTFSLDAHGQWQWFGNLTSRDVHKQLPELAWRGKIAGSSPDDFSLQDVFVTFGGNTRLVLDGGCESGHACQFGINTSQADSGPLFASMFGESPLSGKLDASLTAQQAGSGWRIDGKLGLHGARWAGTKLPDSVADISGVRVDSLHKLELDHADIRPDGDKGMLELSNLQYVDGRLSLDLLLDRLQDAWAPLGDVWLARLLPPQAGANGKRSVLDGSGELDGSMHWQSDADESVLQFSLDAGKARLAFGKLFSKPAGLVASGQGSYRRGTNGARLKLTGLQLGGGRVGSLEMVSAGGKTQLSFAGAKVDLDAMKKAGLVLPAPLGEWHGSLAGGLSRVALHTAGVQQAMAAAQGSLSLKGFGHGGQSWSGDVLLNGGRLASSDLRWQQGDRFAEFSTDTGLAGLRGRLNIHRASLDWGTTDGLPAWLQRSDLYGRFERTEVHWGNNDWKRMRGRYSLHDGKLALARLEGRLAGGGVHSRSMRIESVPGGLHFAGQIAMTAVRLQSLDGLADKLGVKPAGFLFFNARLAGSLPLGLKGGKGAELSGNGDVEIHRGGFAQPAKGNAIHWQDPTASGLAGDVAGGFDKLTTRFRIRDSALHLSSLRLNKGGLTLSGEATVSAGGDVGGRLDVRRGGQHAATMLTGSWSAWTGWAPGD